MTRNTGRDLTDSSRSAKVKALEPRHFVDVVQRIFLSLEKFCAALFHSVSLGIMGRALRYFIVNGLKKHRRRF